MACVVPFIGVKKQGIEDFIPAYYKPLQLISRESPEELSKLIDNKRLGNSVDTTITKIEVGAKGVIEIENAAKSNFFLRGYF